MVLLLLFETSRSGQKSPSSLLSSRLFACAHLLQPVCCSCAAAYIHCSPNYLGSCISLRSSSIVDSTIFLFTFLFRRCCKEVGSRRILRQQFPNQQSRLAILYSPNQPSTKLCLGLLVPCRSCSVVLWSFRTTNATSPICSRGSNL